MNLDAQRIRAPRHAVAVRRALFGLTLWTVLCCATGTTAWAQKKRSAHGGGSRSHSAASARGGRGASRETREARGGGVRERGGSRRESLSARRRREREEAARREAARREAARRAELARLAAIARQRAADQAWRDETAANIARDNTVGEDMEVRRAAVAALGGHAGAVVVMDPKTGRIYSIVNQEWALRRGFKPCSTIKLVTGLAGLNEKVIGPEQTVSDSSYRFDLTDALAFSNNAYFQSVGGRVGFDRMVAYAHQLGLGEKTGINHPNEFAGSVPLYKSGYAVNHMSSHGDDFEVTPVQLGALVSLIANGGTLLTPHLPRTPEENIQFKPEVRRHVNFAIEDLRRMVPGMIGAVNYGTAKFAYDPVQTIAGKTGTCIEDGAWVGLFASYAPVVDPRLAVVVVSRGSDGRAHFPVAVAGRIYRALQSRFGQPVSNTPIATAPATLAPRPKVDPKVALSLEEEDKEEDAAAAGVVDPANTNGSATKDAARGAVKSVTMPISPHPSDVVVSPSSNSTTARPAAGTNSTKTAPKTDESRPRRVLTNQP